MEHIVLCKNEVTTLINRNAANKLRVTFDLWFADFFSENVYQEEVK